MGDLGKINLIINACHRKSCNLMSWKSIFSTFIEISHD